MKNILLLIIAGFLCLSLFSQNTSNKTKSIKNFYQAQFDKAYSLYPSIPRGILEGISFTMTRFHHLTDLSEESEIGIPRTYGVMGLTLDGKDYFRNNLSKVSQLSGVSERDIIENPEKNILAFAAAYQSIISRKSIESTDFAGQLEVLRELSELPMNGDIQNDFAMNSHLYSVIKFINTPENAVQYGFPTYNLNLAALFGSENYKVLSSTFVSINGEEIHNNNGDTYRIISNNGGTRSTDYTPAIWNAAATCNYTVGRTTSISAVTIHYTAGSYAGSISWFKNCNAQASAHYCLRSSDGQVTQQVLESDKAWHVRTENPYTIGLEHEAIDPVQDWFTEALYQSSAALVRDICNSGYGINSLRMFYRDTLDNGTVLDNGVHDLGAEGSCIKIKGHQHFPNNTHTDPGPYWNWNYYYKLVNNTTPVITLNTASGSFYDTGGQAGNYGNDERKIWTIAPTGATTVTLSFSSFALESNYDFLYIYDGPTVFSHLIGRYNTLSPGTITSTGSSLTVEFRSDCATPAAGWEATWSSGGTDNTAPTTSVSAVSTWVNDDFTATFTDADNIGGSGVDKKFYAVLENTGTEWRANSSNGFYNDNFTNTLHNSWDIIDSVGNWSINSGHLNQTNTSLGNTNLFTSITQDSSHTYLYHWQMSFNTGTNRRAGIYIFCSDATQTYRENAYMVWFRADDDKCQLYTVKNNVMSTNLTNDACVINDATWYDYKVTYNPQTGVLKAYQNNILVSTYTDPTPLKTASAISLRTGNANVLYDDIKVYKSRATTALISVGGTNTNDARYPSPDDTTAACRVKSIIIDNYNNWSAVANSNVKVDFEKPVTSVTAANTWKTGNFTATFTDADTVSGIEKKFYQVLEFNGTTWGANTDNGFFADNFDILDNALWTDSAGTWAVSNGELVQSDESVYNSNIFANLNQTLSNRYLYQFTAKMEGAGTNRRFGFHFFCDSAYLPNRGNSYFVWFRQSTNEMEFYKVTNDVFTRTFIASNIVTTPGQYYDFKITYDRSTGDIVVYRDNVFLGSWKDSSPYFNNGKYISFRSGSCKLTVNDIKVYRSRNATATISVGAATTNDIRTQNPNPSTFGAKIKSIINDNAGNLSDISYYDLNVDFTAPSAVLVNDGLATDIDNTTSTTILSANWTSSIDINSEIAKYYYSIGTSAGATNTVAWTDNGLSTTVTKSGLTLTPGQIYFINVKSENGAGLQSTVVSSDGQTVGQLPVANFSSSVNALCAGNTVHFTNNSTNANSYYWSFPGGTPSSSSATSPDVIYNTGGTYNVQLIAVGNGDSDTTLQSNYIIVNALPVAEAGQNQTICSGDTAIIVASGGTTYLWNTGQTTNSLAVHPNQNTTYTVTATSNNCSTTDNIIISVASQLTVDAGLQQTICNGSSVSLNATGASNYSWSNGNSTSTNTVTPLVTTTYTVTGTSGSCSATNNVIVIVNDVPTVDAGSDVSFCNGLSTTLYANATSGSTFSWNPTLGLSSAIVQSPTATPTITTTYTILVSKNNCTASDAVVINVNNLPTNASLSVVDAKCGNMNGSIEITGITGGTAPYQNNFNSQGFSTNTNYTGLSVGSYNLSVKDNNNCIYSTTVAIANLAGPSAVSFTTNSETCGNVNGIMTISLVNGGTAPYQYSLNGGTYTTLTNFDNLASGTYSLIVKDANSCNTDTTFYVGSVAAPIAHAGNDNTIASGTSTSLTGNANGGTSAYAFSWSPANMLMNANVQNPTTVTLTATTNYTLLVTDNNTGCTSTDAVIIAVSSSAIIANAYASNAQLCSGTSTQISVVASGGTNYSYAWSSSPVGFSSALASEIVTPTATTTYTVTVTSNSVTATDNIIVVVTPQLTVDAGLQQSICSGSSATLGATGASAYYWSNGLNGTTISVTPLVSTTYTVTGTSGTCTAKDSVVVTVNSIPSINAGSDISICNGSSAAISVNATSGSTFMWSPSNGLSSISIQNPTASPSSTTTYILQISKNNCTATDNLVVTVNDTPTNISTNINDAKCSNSNGSVVITNVSGGTAPYQYNFNNLGYSASSVYSGISAGSYNMLVKDYNNCTLVKTIAVSNIPGPVEVILNTTSETCGNTNGTATVSQVNGGTSPYQYSLNGASYTTNNVFNGLINGYYALVVKDANSCLIDTTIQINAITTPIANAGSDYTISYGSTTTLAGSASGGTGAYSYSWSPSNLLDNASIQNPTTVTLTATTSFSLNVTDNSTGCSATDVVVITVSANAVQATAYAVNSQLCMGDSTQLYVIPSGGTGIYSYAWSSIPSGFASNTANATVKPIVNTTYTITVTSAANTATSAVVITINSLPVASFSAIDTTLNLPNATAYFTNNSTNAGSYFWIFGDGSTSTGINPWHQYADTGNYTVTLIAQSTVCNDDTLIINQFIRVDNPVGVDNIDGNSRLTLSPNPMSDKLLINYKLTEKSAFEIKLMDVLGNEILLQPITNKDKGSYTLEINVENLNLAAGTYILKLSINNKLYTNRIIKN